MKKWIISGVVFAALITGYIFIGGSESEVSRITTTVSEGNFKVEITTTGELRAKKSTQIKAPEELRDIRIYNLKIQRIIPEGTVVKKGDFVAELERSEILTKLQDAELEVRKEESLVEQARLDSALTLSQARDNLINLGFTLEEKEIALEQAKYESPSVQRQAQIELEKTERQLAQERKNYETKVKQAEAKISELETELIKEQRDLEKVKRLINGFTIYAPENGMVVYKRNFDGSKVIEGSQVSSWSPVVAELPDFSVMESVTYVNEVDIQKVKTGQKVVVGLDAISGKKLNGTITSVANVGEQRPNSDSKVFEVIIEIAGVDTTLRPSMTTSNTIQVAEMSNTIFVPLEAVHTIDSLNFVFVDNGARPVMQQVELGLMNENFVSIEEGLSAGTPILVSTPSDTSGIKKEFLNPRLTSNK